METFQNLEQWNFTLCKLYVILGSQEMIYLFLAVLILVLLSTHVDRFIVSHMRDFFPLKSFVPTIFF